MRSFLFILANTVVMSITNMTVWFAITFFAYLQTQSVLTTSIISGTYLVSTAVSSFWFGSLVDRYKKKLIMMLSSLFSLACYGIGFLFLISWPETAYQSVSSFQLWILISLLLCGVIAGNIRGIALPTLVSILVEPDKRDKANGMVGSAMGVGFLITSVISGILVGHSGMYWVLILAVVLSIICSVHLLFIQVPEKKVVSSGHEIPKIDISGTLKAIRGIPGLLPLILFTTFNNFLGGVFMALMDAYGLSLVSVQEWGLLWGVLSTSFIFGGIAIAKWGLGKNPLRSMLSANFFIWSICAVFTLYPSIILLATGMFLYMCVVPYIEASEHTIIQKLVPVERQGRVFGFAQSVEQSASPITAFLIGPLTHFIFIPFMTTGAGVELIGRWFGTGPDRGIALVFTTAGILGFLMTVAAVRSKPYKQLSERYLAG